MATVGVSLSTALSLIPDGAHITLPADYAGQAMAIVAGLVARGARNLTLTTVPVGGLAADILVGSGVISCLETAAMSLGDFGSAPRFLARLKAGDLSVREATCPAIHAGLQAAEKGIPFMPLRGIIGSDLMAARPDWRIIDNPFAAQSFAAQSFVTGPFATDAQADPIVLLPAIRPDVAIFHAPAADRHGNVFIGIRRELMMMAHASRSSVVTVEAVHDDDFLQDPVRAAGTIPALYVGALTVVANGSAPIGLPGSYPADRRALARYAEAARTEAGFAIWCAEHLSVFSARAAA